MLNQAEIDQIRERAKDSYLARHPGSRLVEESDSYVVISKGRRTISECVINWITGDCPLFVIHIQDNGQVEYLRRY